MVGRNARAFIRPVDDRGVRVLIRERARTQNVTVEESVERASVHAGLDAGAKRAARRLPQGEKRTEAGRHNERAYSARLHEEGGDHHERDALPNEQQRRAKRQPPLATEGNA
jgi:hypothetical protein